MINHISSICSLPGETRHLSHKAHYIIWISQTADFTSTLNVFGLVMKLFIMDDVFCWWWTTENGLDSGLQCHSKQCWYVDPSRTVNEVFYIYSLRAWKQNNRVTLNDTECLASVDTFDPSHIEQESLSAQRPVALGHLDQPLLHKSLLGNKNNAHVISLGCNCQKESRVKIILRKYNEYLSHYFFC